MVLRVSALATLLVCSGRAWAQGSADPRKPDAESESSDSGHVTAEDVLRALQRKRPLNEVIPPASRVGKPDSTAIHTLRPEGSTIVDMAGTLVEKGTKWILQPACEGCLPLEILPNVQLELMVRTLRGAPGPISFIVSGEVTVFENENYLFAKYATRGAVAVEPPTSVHPADKTDTLPPDASAEDVLAKLQAQKPDQDVLSTVSVESPPIPDRATSGNQTLMLDGSLVVNHPGRLIREGSWWTLAFESDRSETAEPPIRLLPNQALELMVRTSQSGSIGLVFIVSGEATLYNGENYLLIRSVTRRMDLGNLRR